ncbi:MAG: VWA domain-containing protein [Gammaproteobacteria bacterium]
MPELAQPAWLWLALLLPLIAYLRWRGGGSESRFKRFAGTGLRCLGVGTLIVALAGPLKAGYSPHTDVLFALDVSSSIDRETSERALDFVNSALMQKDTAARMGVVVFGTDASVEVLLRQGAEPVSELSSDVPRDGTDIGRAVEVAVGAFAPDGQRRVVLLSDGRENLGRARTAAAVARSIGVEIYTVPLEKAETHEEVYLRDIAAPQWVRVHEPFEIQMTLHSTEQASAELLVLRNGAIVREISLTLEPGSNVHSLVEQASEAGLYEYEAIVNSEVDGIPENNRFQAFVQVRGEPKVLHVSGQPQWGRYVNAALRAQGLIVDEVIGTSLPATLHKLVEYDLVVLDNVLAFDLSLAKMELLEEYVRDAGGGVLYLGGDNSYSAGGYQGTPIERLLPVAMDVRTEIKIPTLAVVLLIDKSGSMSSKIEGEEKLSVAKIAALSAVEVLNPLDKVGVLAFNDSFEWSVAPTEVGNRRPIAEKLRGLNAGGGTNLLTALNEAHRAMNEIEAKVKHFIVLSDGLTDVQSDFGALAERIAQDGITVSTVAFGRDANQELMRQIAAWGLGRFYHTDDPQNIPRIFASETMVVSRDLIVEKPIQPALVFPGEMLEGFAAHSFPPLAGYQRAFPKPAAQILLSAAEQDPLLVSWRYGLGKSVAFTSDLAGRWGREWVSWPQFGRLVAQIARWTMRRGGTERLLPEFHWQGRHGEIVVDALDRDDRFINGLEMQATITDPRRGNAQVALEQVAPGRYRGEFEVNSAGRYYFNLSGTAHGVRVGPKTFGLAVPYSAEFLDLGVDRALLEDLAAETGGRMLPLAGASLSAIMATNPHAAGPRWRIWWPLALAALLLLLLEVAVRKLVLPATWIERWNRLLRRSGEAAPAEPAYDELVSDIAKYRKSHLEALRDSGVIYNPNDPAVRARLYLAKSRQAGL